MSFAAAVLVLVGSAALIALFGSRMTGLADRLADRTGLGEAFVGAVFLGAATSLPGITASVTAALMGDASLALSNAIGGIAAQTAFLAFADLGYRRANLEHAAASLPNMIQAALLIALLAVLAIAIGTPDFDVLGVHPVSPLLLLMYLAGLRFVRSAREHPMWLARRTRWTAEDEPEEAVSPAGADRWIWGRFAFCAVIVIFGGYAATQAAVVIADDLSLNHSVAGALFTAVATSLPELVTSIAAVRRGALTLAVGGVIGGNCFDTLFAAVSDVAFRGGSIYHATGGAGRRESVLLSVTMLMTAVLLLGMLRRETRGPARIGFESAAVLMLYAAGVVLLGML